MKKIITAILTLACVLCLVGCSGSEGKVWDWAQGLNQEDIISVIPWCHDEEHKELEPLDDEEIRELVTLLNNLTKKNFTKNKHLVGTTPTAGIIIEIASGDYKLTNSPSPYGKYGKLQLGYGEKPWWIDDTELLAFFERVTDSKPTE